MKKAFTLIELLVVVAIVGVLAGILTAVVGNGTESGRAAICMGNLKNLANGVQLYAGAHGFYPAAGSHEQMEIDESRGIQNVQMVYSEIHGWISWNSDGAYKNRPTSHAASGGWFSSTYDTDRKSREYCVTNGAIWAYMSGNWNCYRCPCHQRAMKKGKLDPNWSYVMNAYFGWDTSEGGKTVMDQRRWREGVSRLDRRLLFAELNWERFSGEKVETGTGSGLSLDCTLQYDGGKRESIGFNHKNGRDLCAHVVYADGHVDRLMWHPEQDLKELTKWLCEAEDVAYNGKRYEKLK